MEIKVIMSLIKVKLYHWSYWASQLSIAGPIGLAIITSLAKNVLTLLKSLENPGPYLQIGLG